MNTIVRAKLRNVTLLVAATFFSACGTTLADVPTLRAHQVDVPPLPVLSGRSIALRVIDARPAPLRQNQVALEQALHVLMAELFASRQLSVAPDAPLRGSLTVRDTSQIAEARAYPQERCVALALELEQGSDWSLNGLSYSCHHLRRFGMTAGGDISQAYRLALNKLLAMVAQQVQQMGPPPASAGGEQPLDAGGMALLSVRVWPPSAQVFVDGAAAPGTGTVEAVRLPAGTHRVRVHATGMTPFERTVRLHPRHHEVLTVRLSAPDRFGPAPR